MKSYKHLSMPFSHRSVLSKPEKEIQKARRAQNNVYHQFNSKRNAGRITRYFILLRSSRLQRSIFIVGFVFLIILIAVFLILMRDTFIRNADMLKTTILRSMYFQIDASVQYLLQIPTFYSSFLGNFMVKSDFDYPTMNTANFYAALLTNAHLSSTGHITWWKIGLPSGGLIAVATNESYNNLTWCFAAYSGRNRGKFFEWATDELGRNSSYPYTQGVQTGIYNTSGRYWYEMAISTNHTTWTNLFYESVPENSTLISEPTFSAVSSVWEEGDILICAISLDMRLRYIQEFLRSIQMPNGSALAITSSDGFLVAVTSSTGFIFDVLDNGLIAASIQDIDEPIWKCISRNSNFRTAENFSTMCNIEDRNVRFQVFQSLISFSDTINWTLHAAIRADEVYQTGIVIYNNSFVISSVICVIICIIVFGISQIVRSFMLSEQTKLLFAQKHHDKTHVCVTGIFQAFTLLRKISTIHSTNKSIAQDAWGIASEVSRSPQSLFYDIKILLESIEDPLVRNKIISVYDVKANVALVNSYRLSREIKPSFIPENIFIDQIPDSQTNMQSESVASLSIDFDRVCNHQFIHNLDPESGIGHIKAVGQTYNVLNPLFDDEKFIEFLNSSIPQITNENTFLIVDSFDMYGQLMKFFGQPMVYDQDIVMAGYISLIAFHRAMENRFDKSLPLIRHYFLIDKSKILWEADKILIQLSQILNHNNSNNENSINENSINENSNNENNNNENSNNTNHNSHSNKMDESDNDLNHADNDLFDQRWHNFVTYVHTFVNISIIEKHIETIQRCRLFISGSMRGQKLLQDRSVELMNFLFLISTVSYVMNTSEFVKKVHSKLVPEVRRNVFAEHFLPCFNSVYVPKLIRTLTQLAGKKFVHKLMTPA
ncbi:hypothetical protein TRFO_15453 [Tritrichomonas foetus]|uniref:Uncharacterized protein n=1 Tax=Tritrichomonas foetus TaxID=1144522 RepID=A0A1J4KSN4_9EUKA|nr:hypothetical protein TRFO_15453 [Tritrichomonas foetus]|eukprot:OHT14275.1 hypothetical protein TRFO_15453 [Tritrichomonas foetus]